MRNDNLWAVWRSEYVTSTSKPKSSCVFCDAISANNDEEYYILHRGSHVFIIMNRYPYNNGHLMIIPYRHIASFTDLSSEELAEMMALAQNCTKAIKNVMHPDGFNIGLNLGKAAGAGIDEHLHLHIVPRWNGDTNFMPVLANARVIPEHMAQTYNKIKSELKKNG